MNNPLHTLPTTLRNNTTFTRLGPDVPALIATPPEATTPTPALLWMHGRTAHKELDNGRYLRLLRANIASIALDLPGHGERKQPGLDDHSLTPTVINQMLEELPEVLQDLKDNHPNIDTNRIIIGGMSAGGMVAARACYNAKDYPAAIRALIMESSTGWLKNLYDSDIETPDGHLGKVNHTGEAAALVTHLDTRQQLDQDPAPWPTIPVLALHSEADRTVPIICQQGFINTLKDIYQSRSEDPNQITLHTWPTTGAPFEHAGFGKVASEAKSLVTDFCTKHLHE